MTDYRRLQAWVLRLVGAVEAMAIISVIMPRSWMVFLPRCGHAAMLEQPDTFAAIVRSWLTETRPLRETLGAEAVSR